MLPTSSLMSHGGRRTSRATPSSSSSSCSVALHGAVSPPCSSSPSRVLRPHAGRSLATQLRLFLCGCGLLYVLVLWHSGLWTPSAPTDSTSPVSMRTKLQTSLHGRAAQEIRSFPAALEPQDVSQKPQTPASVYPSATASPPTTTEAASAAPTSPPTPPAALAASTEPPLASTRAVESTVSVIPTQSPVTPTSTPVPGMIDAEWLLKLMATSAPAPYTSTATDTTVVSYAEHLERMSVLEEKRLRSLSAIGVLKNKLHKVRAQLEIHGSIIAEEDAKLVTELPRVYKQQPQQSSFKCLGWRATADCDPRGKRVPSDDRSCLQNVPPKMAGYCEIEDTVTKQRFRVMLTACDTLRWDASLRCFDAWHFPNFAIQSMDVLRNASREDELKTPVAVAVKEPSRGIVLVVYPKMLPSAYATLRTLRRVQCSLPVELWYKTSELEHAASHPIIQKMMETYGPLVLRSIDDTDVQGFTTKIHAIRHSNFDHVLFLDADNVPVKDPTFLFDLPQFQSTGALFWPDFWHPNHTIFALHERSLVWEYMDLAFVDMFEQESGQLVVDKTRAHSALALVHFYAHSKPNLLEKFKLVHGDKDLFRLAWLKSNTSFYMVDRPPAIAGNVRGEMFCGQTMVQFDPQGDVLFLHRNAKKLEGRHAKQPAVKSTILKAGELVTGAPNSGDQEMEVDPEIWTHLLQLKPTSARANYTVEIYEASADFPKGQWCYGKPSPATPHFNTFRFVDLPFRDVENEIRAYAIEATDLLANSQSTTPTTTS